MKATIHKHIDVIVAERGQKWAFSIHDEREFQAAGMRLDAIKHLADRLESWPSPRVQCPVYRGTTGGFIFNFN